VNSHMSCRDFPHIYGSADEIYDEEKLRGMLNLNDEETCADYYGHYKNCCWVVIECKSTRHLMNAIKQLEATVRKLLNKGKPLDKVILVANSFGKERNIVRKNNVLCRKIGNNMIPLKIGNIIIEAWQMEEINI
jgi:hypothetical protein